MRIWEPGYPMGGSTIPATTTQLRSGAQIATGRRLGQFFGWTPNGRDYDLSNDPKTTLPVCKTTILNIFAKEKCIKLLGNRRGCHGHQLFSG